MKALVIGGTGPTGSYLVNGLIAQGYDVSIMHRGTHIRYPVIYGPRQVTPNVWGLLQRFIDKRPDIVLPDGGLTLTTHGYSQNVAHAVLLAAQQPDAAAGQVYNCGDERQLTLAQWLEVIADAMDNTIEIVGVPDRYAYHARSLMMFYGSANHQIFDLYKLKAELGDLVDPVEALRRTVQWYRDNSPKVPENFTTDLTENYRMEDDIVPVYCETCVKLEALDHVVRDYHRSYPHPKEPELEKAHRER